MKTILTSITVFLIAWIAIAYSPATPELYVITSGGKFFFVMDPGNFSDIPSKGIAYRAKRNGVKKLWEVTGWDQSSGGLFLSEDGEFLVRIRGAIDHPNKEVFGQNEILLFYRRGKLIKSYALKELVLDLEKGIIISSMPPNTGWINYDGDNSPRISPSYMYRALDEARAITDTFSFVFQLTTLEGTKYLFDVKTGLIIKQIVIKHKEDDPGKHDLVDPFAVDSTSPSATKEAEQVMPPNGP